MPDPNKDANPATLGLRLRPYTSSIPDRNPARSFDTLERLAQAHLPLRLRRSALRRAACSPASDMARRPLRRRTAASRDRYSALPSLLAPARRLNGNPLNGFRPARGRVQWQAARGTDRHIPVRCLEDRRLDRGTSARSRTRIRRMRRTIPRIRWRMANRREGTPSSTRPSSSSSTGRLDRDLARACSARTLFRRRRSRDGRPRRR